MAENPQNSQPPCQPHMDESLKDIGYHILLYAEERRNMPGTKVATGSSLLGRACLSLEFGSFRLPCVLSSRLLFKIRMNL